MIVTCKKVMPTNPPKVFVIELSEEEAGILWKVCRSVGGDPDGPRGTITKLGECLGRNGIDVPALMKVKGNLYLSWQNSDKDDYDERDENSEIDEY